MSFEVGMMFYFEFFMWFMIFCNVVYGNIEFYVFNIWIFIWSWCVFNWDDDVSYDWIVDLLFSNDIFYWFFYFGC